MNHYLELLDWRRRVASLYGELRSRPPTRETAEWYRLQRDLLFREHPQSPIPVSARASFRSLCYWPWDPRGCVEAWFRPLVGDAMDPPTPAVANGEARLVTVGAVTFELLGAPCELQVLWLDAYGGGIFIPFRDATSGMESYGGGRYLIDSVKGADLGSSYESGVLRLDFNYAYHPSCAYDPIWPCPLAPPKNRLQFPIRLGERMESESAQ